MTQLLQIVMGQQLVLQRFQLREELQLTLTILVQEHKLQELSQD